MADFGALDDDKEPQTKDEIVREAFDRWKACYEWQGTEDQRAREDIKFANGDARNTWQWPESEYKQRDDQHLPCLTINSTRVHNDMVINAMSKNNFAPKVRPAGQRASYASAQVVETLVRRTLDLSRASSHFRKVAEQQVDGGIGYIILDTDYVSSRSFDQDIFVSSSRDPTGVYLDPWRREPDGLDSRFGFIFDRLPRKEFNRKYPQYKNAVTGNPLDSTFADWVNDREVMVVKYYRKSEVRDVLISYKDGDDTVNKLASEIKDEAGKVLFKALMRDIDDGVVDGRHREVVDNKVQWFLIAGSKIVDKGAWAGKYVPILPCVGRELVVDNTLDRKGHTRPLISAQMMLNYNASTAVQVTALSPKAQWIGPTRAFEGQEQWKDANEKTYFALAYNDIDEEAGPDNQKIEAPQRIDPPQLSAAHVKGMEDAERQMMMISGQFQAQMGENDTQSAASGKAIGERQEQGDTATYHFVEHQRDMYRALAIQLIDLYPRIYDTKRMLHIEGDAAERYWIQIDPDQETAVQELQDVKQDEEAVRLAFNPQIGEYLVVSDPGPDFATQRQEAWNAYSLILQQNMQLAATIGDLIFRFGDFPGADKIADRLEKEIKQQKPWLFSEDPNPQLAAAQEQMQRLAALNAELLQKLALKEIALKGKDERRDVEASNAETKRLAVMVDFLAKTMLTPAMRAQMEHDIMSRSHDAAMSMVESANAAGLQQQATGADDTGTGQPNGAAQ